MAIALEYQWADLEARCTYLLDAKNTIPYYKPLGQAKDDKEFPSFSKKVTGLNKDRSAPTPTHFSLTLTSLALALALTSVITHLTFIRVTPNFHSHSRSHSHPHPHSHSRSHSPSPSCNSDDTFFVNTLLLRNDFKAALLHPWGADTLFLLGPKKQKIYAHSFLIRRAHYFEGLLFGPMRTGNRVIRVGEDTKRRAFMHLLEYLYTGEVSRFRQASKKKAAKAATPVIITKSVYKQPVT